MQRYWKALSGMVALVVIWELMSRSYHHLTFVLPPPSAIVGTVFHRAPLFVEHSAATLTVMTLGFLLALAVALPLGWIMLRFPAVSSFLQPTFVVIQCIPMFTLAPIMVVWFGWTLTAMVIPTALMVFFPLTLSIFRGVASTPQALVDYFEVNHATGMQEMWKLRLPWALPQIFSGLRISASVAGIGAIAGEWAGAQKGLGVLMLDSRRAMDLETTFGALFCLTVISLSLYGLAAAVESLLRGLRGAGHSQRRSAFGRAAAALCLACTLTACSTNDIREDNRRLLVLDWLPNPNHVPLFVGIDRGFFSEAGIDIKMNRLTDPADGLPLVASEQADLAVYYMPAMLIGAAQGVPVHPVAVLVDQPLNSIIYRKDSGIHHLEDLGDKVVGYCVSAEGSTVLESLLESIDATPKQLLHVGFDLVPALATGQVDAIYGAYYNIEVPQLRALGVEVGYFPLETFDIPSYHELVIVARQGASSPSEKELSALRSGLQRSIDWCRECPEEAFEIYAKANAMKSASTLGWERKAWKMTLPALPFEQRLERGFWQEFSSWQHELGLVDEAVDVGELL